MSLQRGCTVRKIQKTGGWWLERGGIGTDDVRSKNGDTATCEDSKAFLNSRPQDCLVIYKHENWVQGAGRHPSNRDSLYVVIKRTYIQGWKIYRKSIYLSLLLSCVIVGWINGFLHCVLELFFIWHKTYVIMSRSNVIFERLNSGFLISIYCVRESVRTVWMA